MGHTLTILISYVCGFLFGFITLALIVGGRDD